MFFACLLAERGLSVDHVTVWRWVQRYAPEIQCRLRPRLRPTNDSWRVDGTYIRVKGKWVYCIPGCRLHGCDDRLPSAGLNATQQRLSAFSRRPWAERTIRRRGLSTPTSTPVIHRPSCGSKPRRLWKRIAGIDRCSTSIMFWTGSPGYRSERWCAGASVNTGERSWRYWTKSFEKRGP